MIQPWYLEYSWRINLSTKKNFLSLSMMNHSLPVWTTKSKSSKMSVSSVFRLCQTFNKTKTTVKTNHLNANTIFHLKIGTKFHPKTNCLNPITLDKESSTQSFWKGKQSSRQKNIRMTKPNLKTINLRLLKVHKAQIFNFHPCRETPLYLNISISHDLILKKCLTFNWKAIRRKKAQVATRTWDKINLPLAQKRPKWP